ncbi:MAG TPA: bifunctional UDP-sugar hydrolase/5'-nucleotidase [Pseudogracilibacillus sp.]|nr:bifunctional UDP-sugar hydrolase/5'-nucleotidase [Pseudogracilibacillus sp.]
MKENIYFYYTNDLHSYFDHWPQIVTFLEQKRRERNDRGEQYWTVDIGDHLDRVHPITEATMGKANVELLNEANYDFATLGNNEGITLSHSHLYHLYDKATFDVLCANIHSQTGDNPPWLQRSKIIRTKSNVKIGLFGITAPFSTYYNLLGWETETIDETVAREIYSLKNEADIIILLSHVGIDEDYRMAKLFPEIDCIIGGHTHHLLQHGEYVNNTLLTAAGKHCAYVGEVQLTWDHEQQKLVEKQATTTRITHLHQNYATKQRIAELEEMADVILNKPIIETSEQISIDWFKETNIMKLWTEKLREWTDADCAMLNAGLLIEPFQAGTITYKNVHEICPHPINPCVVTVNGDELQEIVRAVFTEHFMQLELKGFGFRGKKLGKMIFANLDVTTNVYADGTETVKEVLFAGEKLDRNREYKVATADTFTFGRLLPPVARARNKRLFLPEFIREILVQTLIDYGKMIRSVY